MTDVLSRSSDEKSPCGGMTAEKVLSRVMRYSVVISASEINDFVDGERENGFLEIE